MTVGLLRIFVVDVNAEAVLHLAEIEEQQFGVDFGVDQQLRGQRLAHVADRRKRGDDQRPAPCRHRRFERLDSPRLVRDQLS